MLGFAVAKCVVIKSSTTIDLNITTSFFLYAYSENTPTRQENNRHVAQNRSCWDRRRRHRRRNQNIQGLGFTLIGRDRVDSQKVEQQIGERIELIAPLKRTAQSRSSLRRTRVRAACDN